MRVAIIGGGPSGRSIERAMTDRGISAQLLSRSTGFDVFDPAAAKHLGQMDAVVEATGHFTTKKSVATDFFTRPTRAVANLVRETGASKHILLSIENCEKPEVQGYGYFAGKAEQERIARTENATIVRSTQWFEFAEQNLDRLKFGPLALVPAMMIKPVALDAVAAVIAECVLGDRSGKSYDVAGPEVMTLWDMTKKIRGKGHPVPERWCPSRKSNKSDHASAIGFRQGTVDQTCG